MSLSLHSARVRHPVVRPLVAAMAILLPSSAVFAQQEAGQTEKAATLDTISVTAARKVENIQDVPVSISTVNGEELDALVSGGTDIRFLSGRVPSLNIESSFGRAFPRFYIRGYGNTDFRMNTSQPVSLVYDDIVQENPILKGFPLFDLQQVEVLRGPQGSLFGRNTPAGVVKFDSIRPSQEFDAYTKVGYGSDNLWNVEAAAGGALTERWSARASMLYQHRDNWVKNTGTGPVKDLEGYDETAGRVQFLYEGEDFEALINAHARHLNGTARLFRANIFKPGTNDFVDGFDPKKIAIDGHNQTNLDTKGASARLAWDLGDYKLHSITGYESVDTWSVGDVDGSSGPYFTAIMPFASETADGIPKHSQWTQELRLESQFDGSLNWQGGVFFFKENFDVDSYSYDTTQGSIQDGYQLINQTNDAWAVFGGLSYQATDKWELRAGVRYTVDKKDLSVKDYWNTGFSPCFLSSKCDMAGLLAAQQAAYNRGDAVDPFLSASTKDKKFNWDASAIFAVNDDVNVYGRVATGFRGSSIQSASAFNEKTVAKPETVLSFEVGVKSDFWDNRARVNASVYHYRVKDQQLTAVGGSTGNANILLNADKTTGKGFEIDAQAYLTDSLLVTFGSGFNKTEIKDALLSVSPCAACTVTNPVDANGKVLINGNSLPQAPEWTHNLTARWSMPAGDNGEFYVFTDWVYRGKVNFFLYESKEFTGKALTEGGLRLGYSWNYGDYDVALYGRNITNQIRATGAIDFINLTGFINEPRLFGVEFNARF